MNEMKTAVVTGGGSGIGAAIARELARRGFRVVVTDIDSDAAQVVAEECGGDSRRLDVTDGEAAAQVAIDTVREAGSLDAWISNAGISRMARFVDIGETDLDRTLAINLKGPFLCGQAAAKAMAATGGGVIVNVASMAGKQGKVPFLADYVASKFGVVGLTQAMAFELAPLKIRVNSVCPGYVRTPMQHREVEWEAGLRGVQPEAVERAWIDDTPMGELEEPEDVARTVAFLVGPDASFITGEAVAVNGGAFMD